jgi:peptidoglycan DL-endopeptidase CwlO
LTPAPMRRRFRVPVVATATIITVGLGTTAARPAAPAHAALAHAALTHAAPANAAAPAGPATPAGAAPAAEPVTGTPARPSKPSVRELKKRLDQLNTQAEQLTEQFNKTRVELQSAQAAEKTAAAGAAALAAPAAAARGQLSRLAATSYMSGGTPETTFLNSGGMSALTESAYLVQRQAALANRLRGQIDQATRAQQAAAAKAMAARQAAGRSESAKKAAEKKIAEVTKQLQKLTALKITDHRTGLTATVSGSGLAAKAARKALTKLGKPYVWAAAGPNAFDCSGLVVWAYAQVGKPGLPHYTGSLIRLGTRVSRSRLRSGDLVFFGSTIHHMGIYLSGGKFLHAPQTGDVVKISKLSDRSDFAGATRI